MSLGTRSTPGCLWACHSNGILTLRPARQRVIGPSKKQQLFVSALLQRVVVGQKICTRCSSATPHWPERRTATVPAAALRRDLLLCSSVAAQTDITYRSTTDTEHLRQASVLRAGAYYEVCLKPSINAQRDGYSMQANMPSTSITSAAIADRSNLKRATLRASNDNLLTSQRES